MPIGQKMTIKIHEDDAGDVVFDSVEIVEMNHAAGFTGATTVKKEDFTGSPNDKFVVQVTTDSANLFSTGQTIAQLTTLAKNAVNAVYGNGEAGDPS